MLFSEGEKAEERLCRNLKALIEEWGPENIIVVVPQAWKEYGHNGLGIVKLGYGNSNEVSINVYRKDSFQFSYIEPLVSINASAS